jgi:hypothetical protein
MGILVFDKETLGKLEPIFANDKWVDTCNGYEKDFIESTLPYTITKNWCIELKEESNMKLRCKVDTIKSLTKGAEYSAKLDSTGTLRVKSDEGRWNKYAASNFDVISVSDDDIKALQAMQSSMSGASEVITGKSNVAVATEESVNTKNTTVASNTFTTPSSATAYQTQFEQAKEEVKQQILKSNPMEAQPMKKKVTLRSYLESQGVSSSLLDDLSAFRKDQNIDDSVKDRVAVPKTLYQGGKIWTAALTALLTGRHILLEGEKATGKNVLADNLSFAFGRPMWDISFHTHMDASSLIGAETFRNNQVEFRPGSVYQCAMYGGFGVLDEINMAKPEASAVLHSVLDDRRVIDVPGYDKIKLNDSTRFIGTMNYGYTGTRELNEALASRFVIINVPALGDKELTTLLSGKIPKADKGVLELYVGLFHDLQEKALNSEISTKCIDLRGITAALEMTERGMRPFDALEVCIINKAFEKYEREIVTDLVKTRIPESWDKSNVFTNPGSFTVNFGGK